MIQTFEEFAADTKDLRKRLGSADHEINGITLSVMEMLVDHVSKVEKRAAVAEKLAEPCRVLKNEVAWVIGQFQHLGRGTIGLEKVHKEAVEALGDYYASRKA